MMTSLRETLEAKMSTSEREMVSTRDTQYYNVDRFSLLQHHQAFLSKIAGNPEWAAQVPADLEKRF